MATFTQGESERRPKELQGKCLVLICVNRFRLTSFRCVIELESLIQKNELRKRLFTFSTRARKADDIFTPRS